MWDEVRHLRDADTTVFLTTHDLDEADALCDQLAIIDRGRIVAEGTATELKRAVAGDVVTIGVDGRGELVAQLLAAQPFVREAGHADGIVRLYVDDGETSLPLILRILDGAGLAPQTLALQASADWPSSSASPSEVWNTLGPVAVAHAVSAKLDAITPTPTDFT